MRPSLGKGRTMRRTCLEQPCQVLWYDSAWSCRHLVCLKGKRKVGLLSLLVLLLPSLRFSVRPLSLSLSLANTLSLSLLFSSSEKTAAVQPAHRHPTLPAQPIPSIMAHYSAPFVWIQVHYAGRDSELCGSMTLKQFVRKRPEATAPADDAS